MKPWAQVGRWRYELSTTSEHVKVGPMWVSLEEIEGRRPWWLDVLLAVEMM